MAALTCATFLAEGPSRSRRPSSEACKVAGTASEDAGTADIDPWPRSAPASTTALVNSSTKSGTPSVRSTISSTTSGGNARDWRRAEPRASPRHCGRAGSARSPALPSQGRRHPLQSSLLPRCGASSVRGRRAITNNRATPSPQSSNLRVGSQLPLHIVTAGPEDDASGAAGLELGETLAQLRASACEGHLFGGGYVDERIMAVRNVEGMTAVNGQVADVFVRTFDASQPRFAVRQRFHAFRIGRVPEVIGERDERSDGGRGARRGDVLAIIEDRAAGRHEAGLEPFGRAAEGNQAVGDLFGERPGLGALACHVDRHVDRTIGQPAVGREDLGETAVDVGNVAAQQCLNLNDMRAHAREAQGLLAHPRTAGEAGAEADHQASRRDLLERRDGRGLRHWMAIARDQHGGAEFEALRLFGDPGESDPYIVAEGGDFGAPDRAKAEIFRKKRVLDGSGARRQAEVVSQHGAALTAPSYRRPRTAGRR